MFETAMFGELLEKFCRVCHENSKAHGFWDGPENDNLPTKVALMHSELSELLEAFRSGNPPCPKEITLHGGEFEGKKGPIGISCMEEECADLFIRLCDFCCSYDIDLGRVALIKHSYNKDRPYKHNKKI